MNQILVIRSHLVYIFKKYEGIILFIMKFLLGVIVFNCINQLNYVREEFMFMYEGALGTYNIILLGFIFAVLPLTGRYALMALQIAVRLSMNTEIMIIILLFFLCVIFFYIRLSGIESSLILFVIFGFYFKIPYLVPLFAGLYLGLTSVIPIMIGIFIWQHIPVVLNLVKTAETAGLDFMSMPKTFSAILPDLLSGLSLDYSWIFISFIFAMAVLLVYIVSRLSFNYSKDIAVLLGALVMITSYIVGTFMLEMPDGIFSALFFTIIATVIMEIIRFFDIVLDYSAAERVEFSDEDNYYYVKVIPKKTAK